MPESVATLTARLEALVQPGYRDRLLAKGLARGLVWRDGRLPEDAPTFGPNLTTDLLDHGFQILATCLQMREVARDSPVIRRALQTAAEAIESAARHEDQLDVERGFHLVMAAAAFHIGGYAARAFSLFEGDLRRFNLATYERALVQLMRRDLLGLRNTVASWLGDPGTSDAGVAHRLEHDDEFSVDDVVGLSLTRRFHRAISSFEAALSTGIEGFFGLAVKMMIEGEQAAGHAGHVPLWWSFRMARHLFDDLWGNTLRNVLPSEGGPDPWPILRERFIQLIASRSISEIDLWPSQLEAASRVVDVSDDLVVALPTSAGKTRIAELCILRTLADGKRVIYVTPLRALSAQIEHGLARTFRPLGFSVTSVYGASGVAQQDLETLQSASIVVATPEKLDFAIRQEPAVIGDVGLIVLDEGHMIGLGDREIRYEMLVQRLLRRNDSSGRRLVCLSAVFTEGDEFDDFTAWLRSDVEGGPVRSIWRPTRQRPGRLTWNGTSGRLEFDVEEEHPYVARFVELTEPTGRRKKFFPNDDKEFVIGATSSFLARGQTVLVYCPRRASVETMASAFLKAHQQGFFRPAIDDEQAEQVKEALRIGEEWLGMDHPAVECLHLGIGVHHGALPRQFLSEVEHLLRRRILPVCICSPTLAQGLDLCFGVLLFRSLYRYKDQTIPPKEFANVVGRVGRAFVDLDGLYILPVFDTDRYHVRTKLGAFDRLIQEAQQRKLESGVRLLIRQILEILHSRLQCSRRELQEYVLNVNNSWTVEPREGDEAHHLLEESLNELDTAILGIVDTLDLPTEEVAAYLDQCLQSSYWQRRLQRVKPAQRQLQRDVLCGRANWIWNRTNTQQRKAFFAAGIGTEAGSNMETNLEKIGEWLRGAEKGIAEGDTKTAAKYTVAVAKILYTIGPFVPANDVESWPSLLTHWLCGTPLGTFADNEGVSFVQEDIVYRLVWGVEAARLHLAHIGESEEPAGAVLAACLTYGVPNPSSALLMQAGLRSRIFAIRAAEKAGVSFADMAALRRWIRGLHRGRIDPLRWETDDERREWDQFLERFDHRQLGKWRDIDVTLKVAWNEGAMPKAGIRVRVSRIGDSGRGAVSNVFFAALGETTIPKDVRVNSFTAAVSENRHHIAASFFGY